MKSLKDELRFLHNAAPEQFIRVAKELDAYYHAVAEDLINAPEEGDLREMQGRLRQIKALLRFFKECSEKPPVKPAAK